MGFVLIKIKKLRMKNFKSFKKAEIPFSDGFTSIAGPNASGKSNVLDSLLFVFGITSLKLLRAAKLSELINHDAAEDYAKVEVDLQDGDKAITISRMIDSKGVSVFRIDNQKKTLNEVSSLLLELGVQPTGHNFVVQGDITRVIEMNAKQRREIIDEVAGLSEFEEKKAEAIKKLEEVQFRVKDAHLVLNEREKYLNELEEEKKAVQRFNELKEELESSKATILRVESKKIENEMIETKNKMDGLREEVARKQEDKNSFFTQESELEKKLEEINQKLIDASAKTFSTIGREIEEKKAGIKIVKNQSEFLQSTISSELEKEKTIQEEKVVLEKEIDGKKIKIKELKSEVVVEKNRIDDLEKEISANSTHASRHDEESKKVQRMVAEVSKQESSVKEEYFEAKLAKEKALHEKEQLEKLSTSLSAEITRLSKETEEKKKLDEKIKELTSQNVEEKIIQIEKEFEQTLTNLHNSTGRVESLNETNSRLTGLSSVCPTCSQNVDKDSVQKIFSQNSKKISQLQLEIDKESNKKNSLLREKKELHEKKQLLTELNAKAKHFLNMQGKERELSERLESAKQKVLSLNIDELTSRQLNLKQRLEASQKELLVAKQKLELIVENPQMQKLAQAMEQLKKLNSQKAEKEHQVNSLEAQVFGVMEKRLNAISEESKALQKHSGVSREKIREFEKEMQVLSKELEKKEEEMAKATQNLRLFEEEKQRINTKSKNIEEKRIAIEEKIVQKEKQLNELNIVLSKNEIRLNDLVEELKQFESVKSLSNSNTIELKKRVGEIESEIRGLGAMNMKALERFDELKKEVLDIKGKAEVLEVERKAVLEMIEKIDLKKKEVFMDCFNHVSKKFSDIYYHFFGGEGRLSITDMEKPLEGGLLIEAKYKENKLKNIDSMSGGEKSLTALAFVFAIQSFEPAPFYVFDEADAALDRENSAKLGLMIKDISSTSQFIAITHNDAMIKSSDQIIGVALNQQKSSVIGLKLKDINSEQVVSA